MGRAASRKKEQGLLPQIPWELIFSVFDYPLAHLLKSLVILVDVQWKDLCVLDKPSLRSARSEEFGKAVLIPS